MEFQAFAGDTALNQELRFPGMPQRITEGDHVRIDITDLDDSDHEAFHGKRGIVTDIIDVFTALMPEGERERTLYRVRLENETELDFDSRYVRPA